MEFSVQLLQLVHGQTDPALRIKPTLGALDELGLPLILKPAAEGSTGKVRFDPAPLRLPGVESAVSSMSTRQIGRSTRIAALATEPRVAVLFEQPPEARTNAD